MPNNPQHDAAASDTRLARHNSAGHISSAIVSAHPRDIAPVAERIAAMPGNEVHAMSDTRIVVVMEDRDMHALGDRLSVLAMIPGVLFRDHGV